MIIYLKKISAHDINKQISFTQDVLKDFFDCDSDGKSIKMIGKKSKVEKNVTILLKTDPRLGGEIKTLIQDEGGMQENDILLFRKEKSVFQLEVVEKNDERYEQFSALLNTERHAIINVDMDTAENLDLPFNDVLQHNLFGIHIKEKNDALSDENPHICIGWSKLGDLSKIASKDELSDLYSEHYNGNAYSRGQDVGQIWKFIKEMKKGDYFIYSKDSFFHIGQIISDYYYDAKVRDEQFFDYVNNRNVKWLKKGIDRAILSYNINASLSTQMTVWFMNDYKSAVVDLLNGTYEKDNEKLDLTTNNQEEQELDIKYWLLVVTPKKNGGWSFKSHEIDEEFTFKRENFPLGTFEKIKVGDKFIGYESEFGICVAGEIAKVLNDGKITIKNKRIFNKPVISKEFNYDNSIYLQKRISELNKEKFEAIMSLLNRKNPCALDYKRNRIIFGAPGTGKSFKLQGNVEDCEKNYDAQYERVTFHPDYTYSQFVGAYKPISANGQIYYKFVPGPFLRIYVEALKNSKTITLKPFILLIEEINRARVAAVFGDVFQLLDRDGNGESTYSIQTSEDVRNFLAEKLGGSAEDYQEMCLPNNMFIWATMNSADQGVFPMDTAFKRRWNFEYINIDDAEDKLTDNEIKIGKTNEYYTWNNLRKAINNNLIDNGINEDKLLGPFFLSETTLKNAKDNPDDFNESFKNKVIMYLFEDVMKMRPGKLFNENIKDGMKLIYSDICKKFDSDGIDIFNGKIVEELRKSK